MPILRRKDLVCQEAIEILTEYLEGTLSRRQRRRLGAHLARVPQLLGLSRTDPDDHPPHRKYRTRRPFTQGRRRVDRALPPLADRRVADTISSTESARIRPSCRAVY